MTGVRYEALTSDLAADLCEQLRLILEPTLATKLQGDYRTGKRINMKKVIPYIASQFKKDKVSIHSLVRGGLPTDMQPSLPPQFTSLTIKEYVYMALKIVDMAS